jgi:hypothetical protein
MTSARGLQQYLLRRISEEHGRLDPELLEFAGGKDESEIDASIASLIRRSATIAAHAQTALSQRAAGQPASEEWQADIREGIGDADVTAMDWPAYARFRAARGIGQAGAGIFG